MQWNLGTIVAKFDSKVIESRGAKDVDFDDPNHGFYFWLTAVNFQELIRTGNDPLRIVVERGHERGLQVWGSRRMNDAHHTYPGLEELRSTSSIRKCNTWDSFYSILRSSRKEHHSIRKS